MYTDGGLGASKNCVYLAIHAIQKALSKLGCPTDNISMTTSSEICNESLSNGKTKLLVMPGGRDLPYCQQLNGPGNGEIRRFVQDGGSYLGLCAGAYYACKAIEFSKGDIELEICEERELKLYPGVAAGPVYPGFSYASNKGSKPVPITLMENFNEIIDSKLPRSGNFLTYYNGGPYFMPLETREGNTKLANVLATYDTGQPAIVQSIFGSGRVILSGPHLEASPVLLESVYNNDPYITDVIAEITATEQLRDSIFTAVIKYLIS